MRRNILDWFTPTNNTPLASSSANTSPRSPRSSSKKASNINTTTRTPTTGRPPGKKGTSLVNRTPKRESGKHVPGNKMEMTTPSPKGKLQQKLRLTSRQPRLTVAGESLRLEELDTPKLAPPGDSRQGTPSPVRNGDAALVVNGHSSSQITFGSDISEIRSSPLRVIIKDESAQAKESLEDTTPSSTRSVSTSKTEDIRTPESFSSASEKLDVETSSVVVLSSSVTKERPDEVMNRNSDEDCYIIEQVEVEVEVEKIERAQQDDDFRETSIAPTQERAARPIIESSSILSSPPSSLLSFTLTSQSANPVDSSDPDSGPEYGSTQSPEPTPTQTLAAPVEAAPTAGTTAPKDIPTISQKQLRSSALASIIASSRRSAPSESARTATECSSGFVIKAPIVPAPSPSSVISFTPNMPSTPEQAETHLPKKANTGLSSFLDSLIKKSASKPARPVRPAIPSALRDLYRNAAEIQRFDSLMTESKQLEQQNQRLDRPMSDEAFDNAVMTAAVGEEDATQMAELLAKAESEKSKTVEFHYFDIRRGEDCEIDREGFPALPAGWASECLHDVEMRNVMFESGFVRDMIDVENKLPKSVVLWLILEVAREPNDFLAYSYLQTLLLCDEIVQVDVEILDKVFLNVGVKQELLQFDSELTLSRIIDNEKDVRFRIHSIRFTLELLHAIAARRTYECHFFRKIIIFTIRALLDSAVGKSLYSSLSDLFSVLISRIPPEKWIEEVRILLCTIFSTVTDQKERVRLLTLMPINPGVNAMYLRTKLAVAFFLNDVDVIADTIADGRLPIAKRILPELLSNPMYRLRVTPGSPQRPDVKVPPPDEVDDMQDAQSSTPPTSGSPDSEQQEDCIHLPVSDNLKVVVSSDPEDGTDEEISDTTITADNDADEEDFDDDSEEDDDDESSKVDYVLLTQRIRFLNFALMTAVRLDKDFQKIKFITDFLRELNTKIFDPQARFPDRTEAKAAIQACEFRLLYSVVGGKGIRQSVIERHFEYTTRTQANPHKTKKRKEIEQ
ncbi:hypothetical protein POJ06DRAFT_222575 [Lipomyces tetrasporus]|uniref:Uncharacterized protein n=1 Tax=Lipomyces tetrasporus TaxID=54092 RepID=A0AAD7VT74_9ASCO|nr:uncharacterized protein POJ06DRAFT_222575 [Lipomyces tetrasporus]KAJ8100434.1 hypothetical protein POJ06DRAFT_222575 [Lipomyces tetrasporus]